MGHSCSSTASPEAERVALVRGRRGSEHGSVEADRDWLRYCAVVAPLRVILVSDTHLAPAAAEAQANWEAVLRHVAEAAPDAVIHLGDLTQDGAHEPGHLEHGRRQLDRLPVPWHAVPGNHDIGDNPWPGSPPGKTVDAARRQCWLDAVGADNWTLTAAGWTLLGLNAQLFDSGLAPRSSSGHGWKSK
jgi:3',5'-cyclic AMP phosphodiesterase CpdA